MKNILLIGGSYGIGLEIAKLAATTNNVYIASRTSENVPNNCTHLAFDAITDDIGSLALPDTIDGFVYCPGSINLKPFKMLKPEHFMEDLNINFHGLIKTVHGILPKLKNSSQASLLFFSTIAVQTGMPFHTSVAAAKGAIEGFARALAAEYAPSFRVNVIAPSLTDTPLANKLLSSQDKKEKMGLRHPLKRVGTVQDIAKAANYLLSDDASWVTGQIIAVDGGLSTLNLN